MLFYTAEMVNDAVLHCRKCERIQNCCRLFSFLFLSTSLSPTGNSGHLTWVRQCCCEIPVNLCSFFMCSNSGVAASVWDF